MGAGDQEVTVAGGRGGSGSGGDSRILHVNAI